MKNQFASMGAAMTSAYSKTRTAITAPFTPASATNASDAKDTTTTKSLSIAPEVLVAQGNYFESQGNYAKALDSYSRALESEPKNTVALMSMARLYGKQNDSAKSTEFYRKTIAANPSHSDAHAELGSLLAHTGDMKGAHDELQQAVQLQPKNSSYRTSLAGVLLDSGNADAALQQLREVESPAMAQYQLAYLHFNRKNIPATQQHLQDALQIDPNLKPARDLWASIGGAQSVNQMVQQGQHLGQQSMGIYQQAGAVANNVSQLLGTQPASAISPASLPPSVPVNAIPASTYQAPSVLHGVPNNNAPAAGSGYGTPISTVAPVVPGTAAGPYSPIPPPPSGGTVRR
ncbi:MAG: tetratricopeptide repeat protein [Planctomycetota bacterium]|jgi:tetratricopeptide (TPR) repeat protein